jgi:NADPH-dependent 2,4-dienoyl-CoA reductase/sulfur reductase-like enzyme
VTAGGIVAPMNRRQVIRGLGAGAGVAVLGGCAAWQRGPGRAQVVVVGGGCAGATAAKYLRLYSDHTIDVTLIEPSPAYVSAPLSNRVIDGEFVLADLTRSYESLSRRHGVRLIADRVVSFDQGAKQVRLGRGASLRYDKLVLAPGIDPQFDAIEGLAGAHAEGRILAAWAAGRDTAGLRAQLEAMHDGGVFAITIPEAPYRCPPAPYERASLVAAYFKRYKPRSKVLVLDANRDVVAMGPLFKQAWQDLYGDLLEYRNHHQAVAVDARTLTVRFEVQEDVRADVLNVLPPVRAGNVARAAGLANVNARWCEVDFNSFESALAKDVYIIGDAIQAAARMPKSGQLANGHAKVAAAAIVAALRQQPLDPEPMLSNTCYYLVSPTAGMHSAAVYRYVNAQRTFETVPGAGDVSAEPDATDVAAALTWAANLWADMLA